MSVYGWIRQTHKQWKHGVLVRSMVRVSLTRYAQRIFFLNCRSLIPEGPSFPEVKEIQGYTVTVNIKGQERQL